MAVCLGHFPHCCLPAHFSSPALLPWREMLSAVPRQSDRGGGPICLRALSIALSVCGPSDWLGPRSAPVRTQSPTPDRGIIRYVTPSPCICTSLRVLIMKCHSALFPHPLLVFLAFAYWMQCVFALCLLSRGETVRTMLMRWGSAGYKGFDSVSSICDGSVTERFFKKLTAKDCNCDRCRMLHHRSVFNMK